MQTVISIIATPKFPVSLKVGILLKKKFESLTDYKVILTRNKDIYLKLRERTDIAKKFNADIVYGSRINYKNYSRSHNFLNLLANKSLTLYFNILFNCLICIHI